MYQTEEYIVAFIDVLGASNEIKKDSNKSLNIIHEAYNRAKNSCEKLYDIENISHLKPIIKIFSDNIVIAVKVKDKKPIPAFYSIVIMSGIIQHEFLNMNYLVRGGISYGDFFVDDTMLWGKALLDSYYIENNISIYPRIVIHPQTVKRLQLLSFIDNIKYISEDLDGLYFVDYMQDIFYKGNFIALLLKRLEESDKLLMNSNDIKTHQKILWHNNYLVSKLNYSDHETQNELKRQLNIIENNI